MKARPPAQASLDSARFPVAEESDARKPAAPINGSRISLLDVAQTDAYLLAALMDGIPDNIYFKDNRSRFVRINKSMASYLGLPDPADAIGMSDFDYFDRKHAEQAFRDEQELMRSGQAVVGKDEREAHPNGTVRWVSSTKLPLRDRTGQIVGTFGISRDITGRKNAENQLYEQAFYDPLTHLPNRALFLDRVGQVMKSARRRPNAIFAVLFLDVDRFKGINDSLGHAVGDKLLKAIARRLETCLRPGDTVARLGGDEFAILLDAISHVSDAERVSDRIHGAMQTPFQVGGTELFCSMSAGIALAGEQYEQGEDLLRDADTAMYQAKSEGRARHIVFLSGMHDKVRSLLLLENDLRRAVDRREFRPHYQPVVDVDKRRLVGFEALIRWQHPDSKIVNPDEFIPLAEETGLISTIGIWSLEQACLQLRRWQETYGPEAPRIAVNISSRQFGQADLLAQIERVLTETGAAPSGLVLEITESALVSNVAAAADLVDELHAMDIRVCIDDFGMGYSSLGQLERFAIDGLKIDRSFVSRMGTSKKACEIVRTMTTLANNLGISVIAEGVETVEQLARIRELGCHVIQGFLFSRAVPPDDADLMLARGVPPEWNL